MYRNFNATGNQHEASQLWESRYCSFAKKRLKSPLRLGEAIRLIAKIGGYLGRKKTRRMDINCYGMAIQISSL